MNQTDIKRYHKKTIPQLKKIAIRHFNHFVRLRDANEQGYARCISSGRLISYGTSHYQAGHFIPATCETLRFSEDNVNVQSLSDNYYKHANQAEYRPNLVKKIGEERVSKLEQMQAYYKAHGHRWDRITLIDIIVRYKEKVKILQKEKGLK